MIWVPKKNIYMPRRTWGQRKFQRGILMVSSGAAAAAGADAGPAYQPIQATQTAANNGACNERLDSDFYADNDGQLHYRRENYGSSAQFNHDDYCTTAPETGFGDDYHCKLTPQSGSSFFDATGSDSLSTWHALTSDRVWHFDWQDCSALTTQLYDFEISDDGGSSTLDTQVFTVSMDHDTP